jgi:hypothetical protein
MMKDSHISWLAVILALWNPTIGLELRIARDPQVPSQTPTIPSCCPDIHQRLTG